MTTDLKPCPFCGSTELDETFPGYISCNHCGMNGPDDPHHWNARVAQAPDAAGLETITSFYSTRQAVIASDALRAYRADQPDAGSRPTGATVNELLADYTDTVQLVRQAMMKSEPILAVNQLLAACNHLADAVAQLAEKGKP